jgi:hypothetical protein
MGNKKRFLNKLIFFLVPVIPVDYFNGYHIMRMLKIKSIIAETCLKGKSDQVKSEYRNPTRIQDSNVKMTQTSHSEYSFGHEVY